MAEPAVAGDYVRQKFNGLPQACAASASGRQAEDLWRLFESAHAVTQVRIVDYAERAQTQGAAARRMRVVALSLFGLGALAPALVGQLHGLRDAAAFVYALWPLAGGLALFDRRFGASRSCLRDRQAQARLEAMAVRLRYAWAARLAKSGGAISDAVTARDLADLVLTHVLATEALTGAESGSWMEQVRTQLDALLQTLNSTEVPAQAQPRA